MWRSIGGRPCAMAKILTSRRRFIFRRGSKRGGLRARGKFKEKNFRTTTWWTWIPQGRWLKNFKGPRW